jgi:hypothetical protein
MMDQMIHEATASQRGQKRLRYFRSNSDGFRQTLVINARESVVGGSDGVVK